MVGLDAYDPDLFKGQKVTSKTLVRADRLDPFYAFASYPSQQISGEHRISLSDEHTFLSERRSLAVNRFVASVQLPEQECQTIFGILSERGSLTVSELVAQFAVERRPYILRGLVWLAKMEAVSIFP